MTKKEIEKIEFHKLQLGSKVKITLNPYDLMEYTGQITARREFYTKPEDFSTVHFHVDIYHNEKKIDNKIFYWNDLIAI